MDVFLNNFQKLQNDYICTLNFWMNVYDFYCDSCNFSESQNTKFKKNLAWFFKYFIQIYLVNSATWIVKFQTHSFYTRMLVIYKLVGSQLITCNILDSQIVVSHCGRLATRWLAAHSSLVGINITRRKLFYKVFILISL